MTEQTYQDMVARTDASGQIIVFQDNQNPTKSTRTIQQCLEDIDAKEKEY